jgi:hypothetical protein
LKGAIRIVASTAPASSACARGGCAGEDHVEFAGFDAVRLEHALDIDARDVLRAAERHHFALQLLHAFDGGLRYEREGRHLHIDAQDGDRSTHLDRTHRIDEADRHADVERSGGDLLHRDGVRLHVEELGFDALVGKVSLVYRDHDRPEIDRGLPDHPDGHFVRAARVRRDEDGCDESQHGNSMDHNLRAHDTPDYLLPA